MLLSYWAQQVDVAVAAAEKRLVPSSGRRRTAALAGAAAAYGVRPYVAAAAVAAAVVVADGVVHFAAVGSASWLLRSQACCHHQLFAECLGTVRACAAVEAAAALAEPPFQTDRVPVAGVTSVAAVVVAVACPSAACAAAYQVLGYHPSAPMTSYCLESDRCTVQFPCRSGRQLSPCQRS